MRKFSIEKNLHKILQKFAEKDKKKYEIIWKKIYQILNDPNIEHYKNLKYPMERFKRVHIDKSFILIFKYNKKEDGVHFYDFDHHDKVYKR